MKKIIHVDMDAFFASVEQRDNPSLRGKPIVVGSSGRNGIVAAASYEARKFGVHSAMPGSRALQLCPHLIFVRGKYESYKEASQIIRNIFLEYTDLVEPLSIDEAYLDVTENNFGIKSATLIAEEIRQKIFKQTGLTASAGVSTTKFLAKVASSYKKPNGLTVITPNDAEFFLNKLPIEKFHGIGEVTEKKMKLLNIKNGAGLRQWSEFDLMKVFGKVGAHYYKICRGIETSEVNPNRERKSIGAEETFMNDIDSIDDMLNNLEPIVKKVTSTMIKYSKTGKTITLKAKNTDFRVFTRSHTLQNATSEFNSVWSETKTLLHQHYSEFGKIRLLGVSVSNFNTNPIIPVSSQLKFQFY